MLLLLSRLAELRTFVYDFERKLIECFFTNEYQKALMVKEQS